MTLKNIRKEKKIIYIIIQKIMFSIINDKGITSINYLVQREFPSIKL